jgi:YggT family protein
MLAAGLFQILNFVLAALMYTLAGRLLLGLFLGPDSPNFIMRFFTTITEPLVRAVAVVTPAAVPAGVLVAFTFVWTFFARVALFLAFAAMGAFAVAN